MDKKKITLELSEDEIILVRIAIEREADCLFNNGNKDKAELLYKMHEQLRYKN